MGTFFELSGKTMVVIGLGAIGSRVVKVAKAFKMNVIGVRRRLELPAPDVDRLVDVSHLNRSSPTGRFCRAEPTAHSPDHGLDSVKRSSGS